MTVEDVRCVLRCIEGAKGDDEAAHAMRDELWHDVLEALAEEGSELAREALKSEEISFSRWCA